LLTQRATSEHALSSASIALIRLRTAPALFERRRAAPKLDRRLVCPCREHEASAGRGLYLYRHDLSDLDILFPG